MRRLLQSLLRAAALAVPLACTGCFTMLTWTGAPRVHVDRLLGADVDAAGELTVGVAMSDGRVATYRETTRSGDKFGPDRPCYLTMAAIDARGAESPFQYPPSVDGGRVELVDALELGNCGGSTPLTLIVDPVSRRSLEILSADGQCRAWVEIPKTGDTNWSHPGTWLCIVATPFTAVADLALFPIELLVVYSVVPKS
jgi:uncharacterized protein YceK